MIPRLIETESNGWVLINSDTGKALWIEREPDDEFDLANALDGNLENPYRDALERLVKLKDHKDNVGKDEYYEREQPNAWAAAKELLK